ncbi:hypothetical protein SERLADRAFT_384967 [Serpula lacrymans var. lacrymans S7.9]|uniref:Uncharacterized protein n=1 Tax=Serpula lacrymans var. lacrymans (strain S7.9) TaxID=578457 RepID=F8NS11_SERL9|nr:uncharacterized protein SERLADRAFT_384967 [Serpula lacrymans var. lacrymans S7.9]EGO26373.1 hypothetical protein SERLADRAFT_384967 [Serpula lacrymans var. lacrymans S7.9]
MKQAKLLQRIIKRRKGARLLKMKRLRLVQARRLLAKENVAADLRVETERRLKALEADLGRAEASRKERSLAVRYHKIKFFGT